MSAVIEDVKAARTLPSPGAGSDPYSAPAYAMRQRVKRAGFAELRTALVHFGGADHTKFPTTRQGNRGVCGTIYNVA